MPVTPPGVAPFPIRPPCTIGDDGSPTLSILLDVQRVFNFIDDERHLTAQNLLHTVQSRMVEYEQNEHHTTLPQNGVKQQRKPHMVLFHKRQEKVKPLENEPIDQEKLEMQKVKDMLISKHAVVEKLEVRSPIRRDILLAFFKRCN
jgi:hypothetical protein